MVKSIHVSEELWIFLQTERIKKKLKTLNDVVMEMKAQYEKNQKTF